ncbi:MAG: SPOR domain-containing protein [Ghiorsea sp.]
MADKDFAQTETSQFPDEQAHRPTNYTPLVIASITLLGVAVCFATGFYIGEQYGTETSKSNKHAQLVTTLQSQQQELKTLKAEAKAWQQQEASTSQVGELTFYNELPNQSIIPEPIHANGAMPHPAKTPIITNENDDIQAVEKRLEDIIQKELSTSARSFRIQVASFKQHSDAKSLLPKLEKIGISSTIQKVNLPNIGVWYRVYSTPFAKEQQAMHTKLALKEKLNITGILIQDD